MPNGDCAEPGPHRGPPSWPDWYAQCRVLPYLRMAVDAGTLNSADASLVESATARAASLAGPAEPPSRIHGDCWSGNVLWSGGSGWLIDPAAHGGHRETDLAMLTLFGAPYLDLDPEEPTPSNRQRWQRGGGCASRCISSIRCSCMCACSALPTGMRRSTRPAPSSPSRHPPRDHCHELGRS